MTKRNPFTTGDAPTLADVLVRLEADTTLPVQRRRDLCSAIRTVGKWFDLGLTEIPANYVFLRRGFEAFHPRFANVSQRRVQNVRSLLTAALDHVGIPSNRQTYLAPLAPAWRQLSEAIPSCYDRDSLARFMRFCSAAGISPEAVTDDTSAAFRDALIAESLTRQPETAHQTMCRAWNRMRDIVNGWPETVLEVPRSGVWFSLPWDAFPQSFRDDVDAYRASLRVDDIFADNAPIRPLRPRTIESRTWQIRYFASALVHAGHDPEAITALGVLVELDNFEAVLRYLVERNGGKTSKSLANLAWCMRTVALHHVGITGDHLEQIKRLTKRLQPGTSGMTGKNRDRLRQFDDCANLRKLLLLPTTLLDRARKSNAPNPQTALLVQHALAIELLTIAPMRIANLASLRLDQHITWSRSNREGAVHITIPEAEVKNAQDLVYELPEESAALLRIYLERYRPLLFDHPGAWLFPSRDPSRPKRADTLASQIARRVWQETGIRMNAHLFRHVSATLILDQYPDAYATAGRVLGDRSVNTVYRYYSGREAKAAHRLYVEMILGRRQATNGEGGDD